MQEFLQRSVDQPPPIQWPIATAAKPATSERPRFEPYEVDVAGLAEAMEVEHPGREGGEGADAAAGDDDQGLAAEQAAGDEPQRQAAGDVDRQDPEREMDPSLRAANSSSMRKRAAAAAPPTRPNSDQAAGLIRPWLAADAPARFRGERRG